MRVVQFLIILIVAFAFTSHPSKKIKWELQGEKVNPLNIDKDLLKQTVIEFINYKRKKTRRSLIELNSSLDSVLIQMHSQYQSKDAYKKMKKVKQNFYVKAWELGYFNSWFKVMYSESPSLLVSGKAIHFNPETNGFCWGTKKSLKDTNIKLISVPKTTYRQLAKRLILRSLPGSNRRWINNSDVSKIGVKIRINKKGSPNKIPRVELLFVLSGNVMPANL